MKIIMGALTEAEIKEAIWAKDKAAEHFEGCAETCPAPPLVVDLKRSAKELRAEIIELTTELKKRG